MSRFRTERVTIERLFPRQDGQYSATLRNDPEGRVVIVPAGSKEGQTIRIRQAANGMSEVDR